MNAIRRWNKWLIEDGEDVWDSIVQQTKYLNT